MHHAHNVDSNITHCKHFTRGTRSINLVVIKYLELKIQISEHLSVALPF